MVFPNGEVARVPIIVSASASDAKKAKDAAIERGELNLGHNMPARTAILRRKEGTEGGYELVDVEDPGRLVPVRETIAKEVEKLISSDRPRRCFPRRCRCPGVLHPVGTVASSLVSLTSRCLF